MDPDEISEICLRSRGIFVRNSASMTPEQTMSRTDSPPPAGLPESLAHPELLIQLYRPWLRSVVASRLPATLRGRMDASDLVQETLLQAYRDLDEFRGTTDGELRAWLLRLLEHQLIDAVRYHRRQRRDARREQPDGTSAIAADTRTASGVVQSREVHELFWKAMGELPEHYRTVILLRQQQDLTFEEIGRRMDRQADSVRMLWGRAVLALGAALRRMGLD